MLIGISVYCTVCGMRKAPRGRSAPPMFPLCNFECPGYELAPLVGDLWPGETEADFGYPVSANGTRETLTLTEPIQIRRGNGMNVIETSTGTCHFFTQDGLYDGWEMPVSIPTQDISESELPPDVKNFIDAVEADREIEPGH